MLKTKTATLEKDNILILRFITGEEIMGKVVSVSDAEIVLSHPYAVGMTQEGIGIGPFTVTINPAVTEVPFTRSVVVAYYEPKSDFVEYWREKSSGLTLPKKGLIV